ncbi:MAG: hypothetical protein IPL05_07530 [Betaproteobacteria bacterium]|nr:hypothetical protein [Betaproteobacteria bacterium]
MGVGRNDCRTPVLSAFLHDVGKSAFRTRISVETGTADQRRMPGHADPRRVRSRSSPATPPAAGAEKTIRHHHERLRTGKAIQTDCFGEAIPLAARIFARGRRVRCIDLRSSLQTGFFVIGRDAEHHGTRGWAAFRSGDLCRLPTACPDAIRARPVQRSHPMDTGIEGAA